MPPPLRARGLVKTHGAGRAARRVLAGVDLEVAPGELVSVVGPSGSGKSTLLNVLGGLDRADGGLVEIDGVALGAGESARARTRAARVGFVFQAFHLVPELTGLENVLLATRLPGSAPGGRKRAAAMVAALGLEGVSNQVPETLSGGEQQRFAVARALVNDPVVLLADEPTGNLDAASGRAVIALLRAAAAGPRAVVMVTHDPAAAGVADRRLELADGRLRG